MLRVTSDCVIPTSKWLNLNLKNVKRCQKGNNNNNNQMEMDPRDREHFVKNAGIHTTFIVIITYEEVDLN